jgi:hypothetical protein
MCSAEAEDTIVAEIILTIPLHNHSVLLSAALKTKNVLWWLA